MVDHSVRIAEGVFDSLGEPGAIASPTHLRQCRKSKRPDLETICGPEGK
jgi:hypothetical protein